MRSKYCDVRLIYRDVSLFKFIAIYACIIVFMYIMLVYYTDFMQLDLLKQVHSFIALEISVLMESIAARERE